MPASEGPVVIVLVGITGEGKSTSGNVLSQDASAFQTSRRMKSMTSICSFRDFEAGGISYRVIDSPGLQDTNLSAQELHKRVRQFADLSPNGVDAFLFVVKRGRFRPEHAQAFKAFQEACSPAVLAHTIFLFTCLEEEDNDAFKDSFRTEVDIPQSFRDCLEKVGGRVVGVENKLGGKERQIADRELVLSCVGSMSEVNKGRYNNEHLQDANKWRSAIEAKAKLLEIPTNQQMVLHLLEDRLHGRCERSAVQEKLASLLRAEARLKAKDVLDAMALLGQAKETSERLIFEGQQLPERCGKETQIMFGEFCSGHRDCYQTRPGRPGNHPTNCPLHPRHIVHGQVAASQRCDSDLVQITKKSILLEADMLAKYASKDSLLALMQCLPPAAAFQKTSEQMMATQKRIGTAGSNLELPCNKELTFHICLDYSMTRKRTCGQTFRAELARINAANLRIAELAKLMEGLAVSAKETSATRLQAAVRGRAARLRVTKMRRAVAALQQPAGLGSDVESGVEEELPSGEPELQPGQKRRTRRGGMNKRLQQAEACDVVSIPATDDGFD